jgi:hypothetical protein
VTDEDMDVVSDVVVDTLKRALASRDERIRVLEQRVGDFEGKMAFDQRLKSLEQCVAQHQVSRPYACEDVSDLIQ